MRNLNATIVYSAFISAMAEAAVKREIPEELLERLSERAQSHMTKLLKGECVHKYLQASGANPQFALDNAGLTNLIDRTLNTAQPETGGYRE